MSDKLYRCLAFDFGGSSGRAILGTFDGSSISLEEIHRFPNEPVIMNGGHFWDFPKLFLEIKRGLAKACKYGKIDSVGIDTWGVDYAFIDKNGDLLSNPYQYRDPRTKGKIQKAEKLIPANRLYSLTGNQIMEINTAFQLLDDMERRPFLPENADCMLLMPDLFNFMLTGVKNSERSISSTTQLFNFNKNDWSYETINALQLPSHLFCPISPSGTVLAPLREDICQELNIPPIDIVSVCGHDTQCAAAAVPASEKDFIFISCGTWSLFGTELEKPLINEKSARLNITNEAGFGNCVTFLKNITGLWLIQEIKRNSSDPSLSYAMLEKLALEAEPFRCFIDVDAPEFSLPGDIPKRVVSFCKHTNQYVPETIGEVVRCIYESLAMKYALALEEISECTQKSYDTVYMLGGGVKDRLLCQMTADACGIKVTTGSEESAVLGNIAVQMIAKSVFENLSDARSVIRNSYAPKTYTPCSAALWKKYFPIFKKIVRNT